MKKIFNKLSLTNFLSRPFGNFLENNLLKEFGSKKFGMNLNNSKR